MLRIVYGTHWRELSRFARDEIIHHAGNGQGGQVLLVPEQFSFETERSLCDAGGAQISRYAEVLSFSRLAERSLSVCGGIARPRMDQGGRMMALSCAVEQVRPKLKFYAASARSADFLPQMCAMIDELKCYRVGSRQLQAAAQQLEGALAVKTQELAILLEGYDAQCSHGMQDPRDRLQLLCEHIKGRGFGNRLCLYVDGFIDFTAMELEILGAFLEQGTELTVCLCCDDLFDGAQVFSAVRRTARALMQTADRCGVVLRQQALPDTGRPLSEAVLSAFTRKAAQNDAGLVLYQCETPRKEVEAICADILAYIRQGGRYRDVTVACADTAELRPMLEAELGRYGIPAFFAEKQPALRTPLISGLLRALRAASGRMEQEDVVAWLKSDCAPLQEGECDLLENYILLWDISGELWQKEWTFHPRGFDLRMEPRDHAALLSLNELRLRCIVPLLRLHRTMQKRGTVGSLVLAVYGFMEETKFAQSVTRRLTQLEAAEQRQALQITRQLYELLIHALEQLYAVQYDVERSAEEFVRLIEILLSQYQVGAIPAVLDAVSVGACAALQHRETSYLFLCGCTDGSFPQCNTGGSLLNEQERNRLRLLGVALAPNENEQMDRAMMSAYALLSAPDTRLCLSVGGAQGAYLFHTLCSLYPNAVKNGSDALSPDYATAKTLGLRFAQSGMLPSVSEEAMDYGRFLRHAADYDFGTLRTDVLQGLYGSALRLSASRIDRYASCRFAFFLRDGLLAQERKTAAFDAPVYGTFVHYVLEHTLRDVKEAGGIARVDDDCLQRIAQGHMEAFLQERIAPVLLRSERFSYLSRRNFMEISRIVSVLGTELRNGQFVPTDFELVFGNGAALPAVEIRTTSGRAQISGAVDRVDLFEWNGHTFFRVVDYKTGKKKFDYTDLLEGRGLQMLIYLFALQQYGAQYYGKRIHPAGVLYVPAHDDLLFLSQRPEQEISALERLEGHRREGLLLDDTVLLQAMEPCGEASPRLLPYKVRKDGRSGDLMDMGQMDALKHYVNSKMCTMTDDIFSGVVAPNPYVRGSVGACSYCPFRSVCHLDVCQNEMRTLKATSAKEFWARLAQKEAADG